MVASTNCDEVTHAGDSFGLCMTEVVQDEQCGTCDNGK